MLSYEVYKNLHLFGVSLLLTSLGALTLQGVVGGVVGGWKRRLAIAHGLGMLAVLIGGFGMLAKLHIMAALPGWVIAKLVIWLILGAMIAVVRRKAQWAQASFWAIILLATAAAYFALFKPF